jgi:hypothetical protein
MKTYDLTLPVELGESLAVATVDGRKQGVLVGYVITLTGLGFVIGMGRHTSTFQADQILSHRHILDQFDYVGLSGALVTV